MRVKLIKKLNENWTKYEALEDGELIFSSGDLPAFTKEAKGSPTYIKKNQHFYLFKSFRLETDLQIEA